jgi:hypothetical protein
MVAVAAVAEGSASAIVTVTGSGDAATARRVAGTTVSLSGTQPVSERTNK